jgi:preprotein translocase subunit SecA
MTIDNVWKEHLRELDELRHSVQNASYEQKDPLVIYKIESFNLFTNMLNTMNAGSVSKLMRGQIIVPENPEEAQAQAQQAPAQPLRPQAPQYRTSREAYPGAEAQRAAASAPQGPQRPVSPIVSGPRVGRNDPCPCGSGKKFKNCHGKNE